MPGEAPSIASSRSVADGVKVRARVVVGDKSRTRVARRQQRLERRESVREEKEEYTSCRQ